MQLDMLNMLILQGICLRNWVCVKLLLNHANLRKYIICFPLVTYKICKTYKLYALLDDFPSVFANEDIKMGIKKNEGKLSLLSNLFSWTSP